MSPTTQPGEIYYSVDVEADGPIPGPYSMSSLGITVACRRDVNGHLHDLRDRQLTFYAELQPISDDFVTEAAAVSGLNRTELIETGQHPATAMQELVAWVTAQAGDDLPVLAAYPLSYDWMWVYWYLMHYVGTSPFGHSAALDIKTLYAAKYDQPIRHSSKRFMPQHLLSKRPHTHHALDDALEQADLLFNLLV